LLLLLLLLVLVLVRGHATVLQRVCENKDFREWYGQANNPSGSTRFHGSAGELARAIKLLQSIV
jgi:hypothetical protein